MTGTWAGRLGSPDTATDQRIPVKLTLDTPVLGEGSKAGTVQWYNDIDCLVDVLFVELRTGDVVLLSPGEKIANCGSPLKTDDRYILKLRVDGQLALDLEYRGYSSLLVRSS
jgi:hypothetical protein